MRNVSKHLPLEMYIIKFTFPQINRIHQRSSRITYNDKPSSFRKLLEKDTSITKRHRNIKLQAFGTCKFLQRLSSPLINEIFVERSNNYTLRGKNVLTTRGLNSGRYGTETVSFLALEHFNKRDKGILNLLIFSKDESHGNAFAEFVKHMYRK